MSQQQRTDITLFAMVALVAMSRLIPHWPNFTPVMAVALVGGSLFASKLRSVAIPLAAMVLSDIALGAVFGFGYALHSTQLVVYSMVIALSLFGSAIRSWRPAALAFGGGSISAIAFFLVTNFAVWFSDGMYPLTLEGLIACYGAGLAFYRDGGNFFLNGLVSTWLFSGLLLGAASLVRTARSNPSVSAR